MKLTQDIWKKFYALQLDLNMPLPVRNRAEHKLTKLIKIYNFNEEKEQNP